MGPGHRMQSLALHYEAAMTIEGMTMDRRMLLGMTAAGLVAAGTARGQTGADRPSDLPWPPRETFDLWPGKAPGTPVKLPVPVRYGPDGRELWLRGIAKPTLSVYRPANPNGIGILSIPGGGYQFVSVENEGHNVAKVLNPLGFTVFALVYRLPGEGWANRADVPLQDAQRAMRIIRTRAGEFGIDPKKLGILGFSAGGHLAASLSTAYNDPTYEPVDTTDRAWTRPDFSGLVYPVTTLAESGSPSRSRANLLGPSPMNEATARYDAVRRVDAGTPPLFLLHAADDPIVPLEMSTAMIAAARTAGVSVAAHFYDKGGHGFGMALDPKHPAHGWGALYATWAMRIANGG